MVQGYLKPARFTGLVFVFAAAVASLAAAPRVTREPAGGIFCYEGYSYRDNTEAMKNPYVIGPLFQLYWSEIEKKPGEFDWSAWDRRLAPWLEAGKKFALRIMWCSSGNWPH